MTSFYLYMCSVRSTRRMTYLLIVGLICLYKMEYCNGSEEEGVQWDERKNYVGAVNDPSSVVI